VGTQGQLITQSGATVAGGPGLVLDSVLGVPRNNVHQGVDSRRVLSVQRLHVGLLELALLGEHVGELVLGPSFLLHSISLQREYN
jgi:hypothetical protein